LLASYGLRSPRKANVPSRSKITHSRMATVGPHPNPSPIALGEGHVPVETAAYRMRVEPNAKHEVSCNWTLPAWATKSPSPIAMGEGLG
jgi:hypothetical protein